MKKIKQNDDVIVIAGKDKGKRGTVIKVVSEDRVVVENINMAKRHTKPNPNKSIAGGIVSKEMPINISNIALYNPATKKAGRVGIKTLEGKRKVRFFKSDNEVIDS
ncbi:MAG: 50S ribosomal protein L24 [Gammaproteobacteria bacterium]|nr:50S ribosomal protein L24 [Gammaproteobacteria bacterium]